MSWEDCGFKPGKIHGSAKCPRQCGDCDGQHHFYVGFPDATGNPQFVCKHCGTTADMVEEDGDFEPVTDSRLDEALERDDYDNHPERGQGCLFPDNCCMPGDHDKSECHTPEMIEDFNHECEKRDPD